MHRVSLRWLFCLMIDFCFNMALAATPPQLLDQKLANFRGLSADFTQTVQGSDHQVLQKSNGHIAILRPGKFRWTVNSPITQDLMTDGKTLWIYEPDLEQVTIRRLGSDLGQTPLILLTHQRAQIQASYKVSQQGPRTFILIPKSKQDNFKKVVITFNGNTPQSLQLLNQLGQDTLIQFSNVKMNPVLNASQFNFKIPKGIDVIDLRK